MGTFPSLLSSYVHKNNIKMTTADELCIYGCFNDTSMIIGQNSFENFAFRPADKIQLSQIAQYINEEIKRDCSSFNFCNPNAQVPTISTIVGKFYGVIASNTEGTFIRVFCFSHPMRLGDFRKYFILIFFLLCHRFFVFHA